ncbi:Transmembrane protein 163 [Collichthys lucidus]|uniref:Transmembrane protein 163 n=1 Tax=Collichthys lucidus TaxID=240159 RepID=A0A4U5U0G8_COLLU|nr:Transmembrane protein 163 [Collichthys lucidus]
MTDPTTQESYPVPDPTIVDPCPGRVRNGQCAPDGFTSNHHQQAKTHGQPETFTTGQEMKITDSVEGEGLLESSMRLKPHEAQSYRKKALWVSWISIVVTLILAVAAFSKHLNYSFRGFNSLVGAIMGFSILISAEVFKHHTDVWFLDGTMGVVIGLIILAYGVKLLKDMVPRVRQTRNYERFE